MATKRRRRRPQLGLTQNEQALLLQEFERLAERSDKRARAPSRRELYAQSKISRRTKRKTRKAPKAKRTSAKAIGVKYRTPFHTKEISHDFEPPIKASRNSETLKIVDKIFERFEKAVRFKKGRPRFFSWIFHFKTKYKRRARYFSSLVMKMKSTDDLYNHLFYAVETFLSRFDEYQLRDQVVRISTVTLKEYNDIPESHKSKV